MGLASLREEVTNSSLEWLRSSHLRHCEAGWDKLVRSLWFWFECSSLIASNLKTLVVRAKMVLEQTANVINSRADAQKTLQTTNSINIPKAYQETDLCIDARGCEQFHSY